MGARSEIRASDADREQAIETLRDACAEGRIAVEELTSRLERVYAATTRAELATTVADLPATLPAERPATFRRRRPIMPGAASFVERFDVPRPRDLVAEHVITDIGPPLANRGYQLVGNDRGQIVFVREWRPTWTILVSVLVFPVGLVALTHKQRDQISIMLRPHDGGTRVIIFGAGPLAVRRALAGLKHVE